MDTRLDDIEAGIRLAATIYQSRFLEEDTTDVRSRNFQNDILNLHTLLEKLQEALRNAHKRYIDRACQGERGAYDPLTDAFENERKTFIGDFVSTLKACDSLLVDNRKMRFRYRDDIESLSVQLTQQRPRLDALRARLNLHTEKIRFALDRLSVAILTDRDAPVVDFDQDLEIYVQSISSKVANKFQEHLVLDCPGIESERPVIQDFDALLTSSRQSVDGTDQTPEKYLLFLKTCWLLGRLKKSVEWQTICPGGYFERAVNQLEETIINRIRRPGELISYPENVLMSLPASYFHIWPTLTAASAAQGGVAHPLAARANEQKIVELELATGNPIHADTVTVFRSSDTTFRIVVQTTVDPYTGAKSLTSQTVYSSEDKLIPRYALPTVTNPVPEMAVFSRREESLYKFTSWEDLCSFQTALTGYDVSHDQGGIRCQFSDDVSFLDCAGRLQLWQEPINSASQIPSGEWDRQQSLHTQHPFAQGAPSRRHSVVSSMAAPSTATVSWTTSGWEADDIKLPMIIIFTHLASRKGNNRLAMIAIPLVRGLYLDPSECRCGQDYTTCSKLVLAMDKERSFSVRVLYSDLNPEAPPDPNTFDIFPFRLPRHQKFYNMILKETKYLVLKFKSLPEKQSFHRELDLRFRVRDKQIVDQREFSSRIRHRQDRPQGRQSIVTQHVSSSASPSILSVETNQPPTLDFPNTGPTLSGAFNNGVVSPHPQDTSNINNPRNIGSAPGTARSAGTLESLGTRLDSMVLGSDHGESADRYVANATPVLTPDTASMNSSPRPKTVPESPQESFGPPNLIATVPQIHKEFYGSSEAAPVLSLSRSPSAAAPEWCAPSVKIHEAPEYYNAFQDARAQPIAPVQWYSPDSMNTLNNQIRHPRDGFGARDRSNVQTETTTSRSKIGKGLGKFKIWKK